MKKLLIIMLSALSLTAFAQQKKVAVYVMGENEGINKVLGSKLVSAIARSNEYSAIERTESFLAELSKEQNYQRTGAVDDSELSRLGKQFGVQYICVAAVSEVFNEKYLSARLIDVESAQVERTASSSGAIQSVESLVAAANVVSTELLSSLDKSQLSNSKKVAVYVVKNEAGRNIGRVLGDKLVAGFTNSGRYIAIERTNAFLSQLNKEQNYQRTGAVDDNELSRLGKQFGVQYVCVADVSDVFGEKFISARLIDVETAEVVNTHEVGGVMNSMSGCLRMANDIAANLSKGTLAEQAEDARLKKEAERARIRAAEEARLRAEREERARIEAEERAKREAEEAKIRQIENKKTELQDYLSKGYIIVEVEGQKWMICINPLQDVSGNEVRKENYYSACGYSDWKIGDWYIFKNAIAKTYSEINHYLHKYISIAGRQNYWSFTTTAKLYIYEGTYMEWSSDRYSYLDGNGGGYGARFSGMQFNRTYDEYEFKMNTKHANALLVRKIR